jgi:hypothetical protein
LNTRTKDLKGSPLRDQWRWLHKQMTPKAFYGVDGDFFVMAPAGGGSLMPIAYIDIKGPDDHTTEAEDGFGSWLIETGLRVYNVTVTDVSTGACKIHEWGPDADPDFECADWDMYLWWEGRLRGWSDEEIQAAIQEVRHGAPS